MLNKNNLFESIIKKETPVGIIGLGYVGMPIAVSFAKKINVIGFDLNRTKIENYLRGHDSTNEVGDDEIKKTRVRFTYKEDELDSVSFYIVAVPTPVNKDNSPDLSPVIGATEIVGRHLKPGNIVVYESTVYPGVTEEICVPILEKISGLKMNKDFYVGYSPERINPGDKIHRLNTIKKIVSGSNDYSLEIIASVYELVVDAGVYKAPSIKVAEAAKVIENSQRDINIAFMNELSIIFHKLGIDTLSVLRAASTKWNFLDFKPGLVGGHCIGVDPYYLTYKAEQIGYHSQIILSGRRINDSMGKYVADEALKIAIKNCQKPLSQIRFVIMGMTFKENCPDARNSKVFDIYNELMDFGVNPIVFDPITTTEEVKSIYGIDLFDESIQNADVLIFAVAHDAFKSMSLKDIDRMYNSNASKKVLIDVKGIFDETLFGEDYCYWRL